MARTVVELAKADSWIDRVRAEVDRAGPTTSSTLPAIRRVPELSAQLSPPQALVRVLPGTSAASGNLISSLGRPAQALLWKSEAKSRFPEPDSVEIAGTHTFMPSRDLTGIHVTPEGVAPGSATPAGLLVGRAERRAWIRESHGTGDFNSFLVDLGWDPTGISLADLELTHEEQLEGEMVSATRLRLEDLDTSAVDALGICSVSLPSVGRRVAHGVSLHTVDGELLDRTGPYPLVERIEIKITANGSELPPVVSGVSDPLPALDERMKRSAEVARDIEAVIRNGAQARIIADRGEALARLTALLAGARGELLVLDCYFGQDIEDWRLLDGVPVPVKVLTGKVADAAPRIADHVEARFRPKALLHERVYLWDGGGLSVGGSPTTFGQAPIRITRLRQAEVTEWRTVFEVEWRSPLYHAIPRASA
jgi:hypothetical protein